MKVKCINEIANFTIGEEYPITKTEDNFIYVGGYDEDMPELAIGIHKDMFNKYFKFV
jgi:hypothetical protein